MPPNSYILVIIEFVRLNNKHRAYLTFYPSLHTAGAVSASARRRCSAHRRRCARPGAPPTGTARAASAGARASPPGRLTPWWQTASRTSPWWLTQGTQHSGYILGRIYYTSDLEFPCLELFRITSKYKHQGNSERPESPTNQQVVPSMLMAPLVGQNIVLTVTFFKWL